MRDNAASVSEVRSLRSNGHHLPISVSLSVSRNQRQILCAAPTIAVAVAIAILSSLYSCIHMYLAPDTMDSEMAPLVDDATETPPWTGRRRMTAETAEEVNEGNRERERVNGRKQPTRSALPELEGSKEGRDPVGDTR